MMKKILLATLLAATFGAASAVEVGVNTSRNYAGNDNTGFGLTVGQRIGGKTTVTAGFDRVTSGADQDRFSLIGGYDVAKFGKAIVTANAGAGYLNNEVAANGYVALVGVGVSYPLTAKVSATVDLRHQVGQARVSQFNGNTVTAGLKYSF